MVATLHRDRVEVIIKRSALIQNSDMSYRDAYGDRSDAGTEIPVNRKPTKVLFLREVQIVFGWAAVVFYVSEPVPPHQIRVKFPNSEDWRPVNVALSNKVRFSKL